MGFRFRKSVRLFPGVRINFSARGISSTIGGRGASINVGPSGSFLNLGIPGSGISYRTRLSGGNSRELPPRSEYPSRQEPTVTPAVPTRPPPELGTPVKSAEIDELTSAGLDGLKKIINEAQSTKENLSLELAIARRRHAAAKRRLAMSRRFIIRIFMGAARARLPIEIRSLEDQIDDLEAQIAGSDVDVDFSLDDTAETAFKEALTSFRTLSNASNIWDVTSTESINRFAERTVASTAVLRKPVDFQLCAMPLVRSRFSAMRLGNANGADIYICPAFVLMRESYESGDFALVEIPDVTLESRLMQFVEDEAVPSDARRVGSTWKKANKDGSRDKRFQGNYEIPIVAYGSVKLRSKTGLFEAYLISSAEKAMAFGLAFKAYQDALAAMIREGRQPVPNAQEPSTEHLEPEPQIPAEADTSDVPKRFVADWAVLLASVGLLLWGGAWWWENRDQVLTSNQSDMQSQSTPISRPINSAPAQSPSATSIGGHPADYYMRVFPSAKTTPIFLGTITFVQRDSVNVRRGPSQSDPVIRTAKKGTAFLIIERQGNWVRVSDPDVAVGWIHTDLIGSVETPK